MKLNLSRRGLLAALGIGTVAGPAAIPAFGRVTINPAGLVVGGMTATKEYYNSPDIPKTVGHVMSAAQQSLKRTKIMDIIAPELFKKREDAQERMNHFNQHCDDMFDLPSWRPHFRAYARRAEWQRREKELMELNTTVEDIVKNWFKLNGGEEQRYEGNTGQSEIANSSRGY